MTFLHKVPITGYTLKWFVVETPASDLKKSCKTLINFEYSKIYAFTPFSCIIKQDARWFLSVHPVNISFDCAIAS